VAVKTLIVLLLINVPATKVMWKMKKEGVSHSVLRVVRMVFALHPVFVRVMQATSRMIGGYVFHSVPRDV
jgi:hypothetical protein